MKKPFILTAILVLCCLVYVCFLGCSQENKSETETNVATITEITKVSTTEDINSWESAYKKIISKTYVECEKTSTEPSPYGQYTLYDFDGDNTPELFLDVYGSTIPDCYCYVYSFNGEKAVLLDKIESGHSWVAGVNKKGSVLLGYWGTGGIQAWYLLTYKNGEFQSEELAAFYPYGYLDIEPQQDPLPSMGYEAIELVYCGFDDLSGINKLHKGDIK